MQVLLINPPYMRLMGISTVYLPLGLGYLARYLRAEGIASSVYNGDLSGAGGASDGSTSCAVLLSRHNSYKQALHDDAGQVWRDLDAAISGAEPDVVGITVMSAKLESAIKVARMAKKLRPGCKVAAGGPHATICPDDLMRFAEVDFVVRGEGEQTLLELCRAIDSRTGDFEAIDGLSFRRGGSVVHNRPRALDKDVNRFPYPTREEYLGLERYPKATISSMMTSRGCPYDCTFCNAKATWTRRVRYRNVDNVIEEMTLLKQKYVVPSYNFCDDSFTANRKRTEELLDKIIANGLNLPWACTTRTDLLDEALVKRMVEAGCYSIGIGLESGSDRMLEIIKKHITMDEFRSSCAMLDRHNVNYGVFLMVGFPEETEDDIRKTIDYVKTSRAPSICLSVFTPYPGCESYERAKEMGMIKGDLDWSNFSHQSPENYFCHGVARERFVELVHELADAVDRHNAKMSGPLASYVRKAKYYSANPRMLAGKVKRVLGRAR